MHYFKYLPSLLLETTSRKFAVFTKPKENIHFWIGKHFHDYNINPNCIILIALKRLNKRAECSKELLNSP